MEADSADCCHERVWVYVCLSVCLFASISPELHVTKFCASYLWPWLRRSVLLLAAILIIANDMLNTAFKASASYPQRDGTCWYARVCPLPRHYQDEGRKMSDCLCLPSARIRGVTSLSSQRGGANLILTGAHPYSLVSAHVQEIFIQISEKDNFHSSNT